MTNANHRYQLHAVDYFRRAVADHPDNICLNDKGTAYSYSQIDRYARAIANEITQSNSRNRLPVVIALPKSVDAVAAIIATQYAGHIYVPVDVKSPLQRITTIQQQLGPHIVLSNQAASDGLAGIRSAGHYVDLDRVDSTWRADVEHPSAEDVAGLETIDSDPAYVMFTSGSTGVPKGVTISHRSIIDYIEWARDEYRLSASDVMMSQAPFYFDNSTLDLYLTWATGASLFIPDESVYMFPVQTLESMAAHGVTTIFWVPSVLTNIANSGLLEQYRVDSLQRILFAGEVMPVKQLNQWVEAYPDALFSNLYGPTEITVDCTAYTFRGKFDGSNLPIGYPCRNTEIVILDEADKSCPAGEVGELCVRGSSLALGYWNDFSRTESAFTQNPLNTMFLDRIYRTGDLVRRDEAGLVYYVGRKDSQIKHMGYRIELGEIEAAVTSSDDVATACVVYESESKRIICAVVPMGDSPVTSSELRKHLATRLPKYMFPHVYTVMDSLPVNANGKIDRKKVMQLVAEVHQ